MRFRKSKILEAKKQAGEIWEWVQVSTVGMEIYLTDQLFSQH